MPSVTAGEIERCLRGKLAAQEVRGRDHYVFGVLDDEGNLVARTRLSRSFRSTTQLSDGLTAAIRRQLKLLRASEFNDLLACPLSRTEYLRIASE
jgi:hypothetical protein